jgi:DNA-binding transcriptional MerR regulator
MEVLLRVKGRLMWRLLVIFIVLTALSRLLSWRNAGDEDAKPEAATATAAESEAAPTNEALTTAKTDGDPAAAEKEKAEVEERRKQIAAQRQELDAARRELEAAERELKELEKQYGSDPV